MRGNGGKYEKNIVIVATGSGVRQHVAYEFGKHEMREILVARNEDHLKKYQQELQSQQIECHYKMADCAQRETLTQAFEKIQYEFGTVDVLLYNAAVLKPQSASRLTSSYLMKCYQIDVASAAHCVQLVLDQQKKQHSGTILFTGGGFGINPVHEYSTVSIGKASLRALALMLHEELKEQGIYVVILHIMGTVAPHTYYDPHDIAQKFYSMYCQRDGGEYQF